MFLTIQNGENFEKNMPHQSIPDLDERLRKSYGETHLAKASNQKERVSRKV